MASITYWSRLEPRPRAASIAQTLAARIRDPLWMLTRQWQFGEFQAEDAASPAYVELATHLSPLVGWRPEGGATRPLDGAAPLEELVESEPFTPDLSVRVELGQTFAALLAQELGRNRAPAALLAAFRAAYPIPSLPEERLVERLFGIESSLGPDLDGGGTLSAGVRLAFEENGLSPAPTAAVSVKAAGSRWLIADDEHGRLYAVREEGGQLNVYLAVLPDQAAARFLRICAGRALDGFALYQAALAAPGSLPPALAIADPDHRAAAIAALDELGKWVRAVFGELGTADPPAWTPERLEYGVEVVATAADGDAAVLAAHPGRDGDFDWHAFDLRGAAATDEGVPPGRVDVVRRGVLPAHVQFRGMPNARWWDFEHGTTDFGDVKPDKRDLARLVVMDFMLVHGNDWFILPFDQPVGSLCRIDALLVHDVFGGTTLVERADAGPARPGERWTMFSTAVEGEPTELADFFLLPPTAATAAQVGPTIEEVRFLRDEMANLVWAVEHTTESGIGQPWPGHERDLAATAATPAPPPPRPGSNGDSAPSLRYQVQTTVPENWIPFLPVAVDPPRGEVALELGAMLGSAGVAVTPIGRVLRPTGLGASAYRVREEEVPRSGVRVSRVVCRGRWIDGSTHLWIARRKAPGAGEGSSGLRFDLAVPGGRTP